MRSVSDGADPLIEPTIAQLTAAKDSLIDVMWGAVEAAKIAMYDETSCEGVALQIYNVETIMCEGLP